MLQPALTELFANAFRHGRAEGAISVEAQTEKDRFTLIIRERRENSGRFDDQCLLGGCGRSGLIDDDRTVGCRRGRRDHCRDRRVFCQCHIPVDGNLNCSGCFVLEHQRPGHPAVLGQSRFVSLLNRVAGGQGPEPHII